MKNQRIKCIVAIIFAMGLLSWGLIAAIHHRTKFNRRLIATGYPRIASLAFSPDGQVLAIGTSKNAITRWFVAHNDTATVSTGLHGYTYCLAYSPDGKTLASGSEEGYLLLWDTTTWQIRKTIAVSKSSSAHAVAYSPNGRYFVTGSGIPDCSVVVWDSETANRLDSLGNYHLGVSQVAFSPDSKDVAIAANDVLEVITITTKAKVLSVNKPGHMPSVAYSMKKGGFVAITGSTVRLWNGKPGIELDVVDREVVDMTSLAFSAEGTWVAAGCGQSPKFPGDVWLWSLDRSVPRRHFQGHFAGVSCVTFSPDGTRLATGGLDGRVIVWDVSKGREIANYDPENGITIPNVND